MKNKDEYCVVMFDDGSFLCQSFDERGLTWETGDILDAYVQSREFLEKYFKCNDGKFEIVPKEDIINKYEGLTI